VVYEQQFVQGQTASPAVQQAWDVFLASLTGTFCYSQVTISGSEDSTSTGVTCSDPVAVNQLAIAMNSNLFFSVECNSRTWNTGSCVNSVELNSNPAGDAFACTCNPGYVVRPKVTNASWGGIDTATCSAPSQSIRVEFS